MIPKSALRAAAFVFAFASSCSHAPNNDSRLPSSVPVVDMSASLESVISSADPRAASRAFVERLLRIEARAHAWVLDTDRAFEQAKGPVDLLSQPSYRRLLVAKPLVDRTQEKIVELYHDAHVIAESTADTDEQRGRIEQARLVIAGVHDSLLHSHHDPAERILLNGLMRELRDARGPSNHPHPIVAPLEGDELAQAAAAAAPALRAMVDSLPANDDVKDEIDRGEADLARDVEGVTSLEGREPQSLNVFPTAARNGNIDGFTFPRGTWAVTFDDGPHPTITEQDLANLKAANTKATFFWLAKNVQLYPQIIHDVQAAGMPVENHSWNHPQLNNPKDLARLNTNLDREINQSTALDTKFYGAKPRFFRCPYGAGFNDPTIRGMIAAQGMIHVRWNVDSLDWQDPNPITVQARVEQQMRANGRGIILFHDIHTPALKVVPNLFAKYKGQIRWVSIPQIVDELNGVKPAPAPTPIPNPQPKPAGT